MGKEGISRALIENVAKLLGMPVGPLALVDETSLELGKRIMDASKKELGKDYQPTGVEDLLHVMVDKLGRLGRKSGGGFYNYPTDGKKSLWKEIVDYFPAAKTQPSADDVKERILYAQLIPAAHCFADGIVHDPQSADLGAIFGWGFAPWTGGPMSYIDTIGGDAFVRRAESLAQKYGARFTPPQKFRDMAAKKETLYKAA